MNISSHCGIKIRYIILIYIAQYKRWRIPLVGMHHVNLHYCISEDMINLAAAVLSQDINRLSLRTLNYST